MNARSSRSGRKPGAWIGAATAVCVAGAIALSMSPASAASTDVTATFGLTGATTSDCGALSTGGSDIFVKPGATLNVNTSLASVNALNLSLGTGQITGLDGTLTVAYTSKKNVSFGETTKAAPVKPALSTGDHQYKFVANSVEVTTTVLGISKTVPISLTSGLLSAGMTLTWSGVIHVTTAANDCKIEVSLPGPTATLSAPVVGKVTVGVPAPTTVKIKNPVPAISSALHSVINKATGSAKAGSSGGGTKSAGSVNYTPPGVTVPQQVMPHAVGNGGGGGIAAPTGDTGAGGNGSGYTAPVAQVTSTAAVVPLSEKQAKPASKTVDLASKNPLGGAQLPVLLAIVSILALAAVTAMYARMYLLRRHN